jgi:hypothetical protein
MGQIDIVKKIMKEEIIKDINESRYNVKKAIKIAKKMGGNMTGAIKKIERIQKGLSKQIEVEDALRTANESVNEAKGNVVVIDRKYIPKIAHIRKVLKMKMGKDLSVYKTDGKNVYHNVSDSQIKRFLDRLDRFDVKYKLGESVNEGTANVYGVDFLKDMKDKKYHKSSLEMVSHQGRKMHKKMTFAIMKNAEKLRKQEGWAGYRLTVNGQPYISGHTTRFVKYPYPKINESVNENLDPYKDFSVKGQNKKYDLNLGAFVGAYQDFIKFMKKHKEVPDGNKKEWALQIREKVGQSMFNGYIGLFTQPVEVLERFKKFEKLKNKDFHFSEGKINETIYFDEDKMLKLIDKDKFLKYTLKSKYRGRHKTKDLESMFNTFIRGDSSMEKLYRKI